MRYVATKNLPPMQDDGLYPQRNPMSFAARKELWHSLAATSAQRGQVTRGAGCVITLNQDLCAFKKIKTPISRDKWVREYAIANLIIPKGAQVYVHSYANRVSFYSEADVTHVVKHRADKAWVHSIVTMAELRRKKTGYSIFGNSFMYLPNKMVEPEYPFALANRGVCAAGIHFYLTIEEALAHH